MKFSKNKTQEGLEEDVENSEAAISSDALYQGTEGPSKLDGKAGNIPELYKASEGVVKIAAATRVWTYRAKVFLFTGIALVSYVYSLDNTTTYLYQAYATSSFENHSRLSTVQVADSIILAILKPISAKISDVFGRAEAFTLGVVFYLVGYIMVACCKDINVYTGGMVVYTAGQATIQIMLQIVIADVTTLKWRGVVSSAVSLPFFINAFVAANIAANVIAGAGWRWGYGMFCFIVPAACAPIIATLFWAQAKARKLGVLATTYHRDDEQQAVVKDTRSFGSRLVNIAVNMDLFGLILLGVGLALLLLPLTLVNNARTTWSNPSIIAMLAVGAVILVAFCPYECFIPPLPVLPFRFFKSRTVTAACIINFFDFVSFYLQFTYQYSFMLVTHQGWSTKDQGYFAYTQSLSLTLFAVLAGFYQLWFGRLKWLLVVGLALRLLGVGVMIYTKGAHGSTGGLVMTQIVQGMGGGIASCSTLVAVQASLMHKDIATATAVILLFSEIGNAIGTAIAGAVWRNLMPGQLTKNLGNLVNSTEVDAIYNSVVTASSYPEGTPIHEGIVRSYDHVMRLLLIAATAMAVPAFLAAFMVQDVKLTDRQNNLESDDDLVEKIAGHSLPPKEKD